MGFPQHIKNLSERNPLFSTNIFSALTLRFLSVSLLSCNPDFDVEWRNTRETLRKRSVKTEKECFKRK